MNTQRRKSLITGLFQAALVFVLLLVALRVSEAQTFFGHGGTTNTAPNVNNVALGHGTLANNASGYNSTATGWSALFSNTTGYNNTAIGWSALFSNTTGNYNTANGLDALYYNTTGDYNTANGVLALIYNTTGNDNTADGANALSFITTGSNNIALGYQAGQNLSTGSYNIDIGNDGGLGDSGVIRIGTNGTQTAAYMAGIYGVLGGTGVGVHINANGQLYTRTSSRRFKMNIQDMGPISDRLMKLRPVTFRYKQAAPDGSHPIEYGLIAEEVAKVYPEMVQLDKEGKPFAVDYDALTPMLLNELQKEHRQNQVQQAQLAAQKKEIASQHAQMASLRSELTALKQSQQQQLQALKQLSAQMEAFQNKAQPRQAITMRR